MHGRGDDVVRQQDSELFATEGTAPQYGVAQTERRRMLNEGDTQALRETLSLLEQRHRAPVPLPLEKTLQVPVAFEVRPDRGLLWGKHDYRSRETGLFGLLQGVLDQRFPAQWKQF